MIENTIASAKKNADNIKWISDWTPIIEYASFEPKTPTNWKESKWHDPLSIDKIEQQKISIIYVIAGQQYECHIDFELTRKITRYKRMETTKKERQQQQQRPQPYQVSK